jgi:hypothetical protein
MRFRPDLNKFADDPFDVLGGAEELSYPAGILQPALDAGRSTAVHRRPSPASFTPAIESFMLAAESGRCSHPADRCRFPG